jgi:UDP-N-acetylglucosamine--N-acetylmuramyl-(pentapeptide) pyrophosphoryl-undecaprenol N-acetylglucosamine transferase
MKKVFLVGGGTGGHLFPAISIAEELTSRGVKAFLITDTRCKKYLPKNLAFPTSILTIGSIGKGFIRRLWTTITIGVAIISSIVLIYKEKPDLVIGFGGYPTFPTLKAAQIMGVKIVLHEQNCFLGKVNKLFSKEAVMVALNFMQTLNVDSDIKDKIVIVGNPVRKEIQSETFFKRYKKTTFVILVIGGSQGAQIFDELIPDAMMLLYEMSNIPIKVIQQAAKKNHQNIGTKYSYMGIEHELRDFFTDMPAKYHEADLVICRSGASTIAELIHVGQPSILIPLPSSASDHQFYNARALVQEGAAWCFLQRDLTADLLATKILSFLENPEILKDMSNNLISMKHNSSKEFVDHLVSILA